MRVLIVAYEFPPSASPQSIRWACLASELAALGADVDVLTTSLKFPGAGLPPLDERVKVHRVFAGPYIGSVNWLASRSKPAVYAEAAAPSVERATLSAMAFGAIRKRLDKLWFPDVRSEWVVSAKAAFNDLVAKIRPDVVIGSHEPAASLMVSKASAEAGIPWIVDLGDPILAPYVLARWRERSSRFEKQVCEAASRIVVTAEPTRTLLMDRHGVPPRKLLTITQGFSDSDCARPASQNDNGVLRLLYSGRFYPFRDPEPLFAAVMTTEGVVLEVIGALDRNMQRRIFDYPRDKIRFLGNATHADSLHAQRNADVLVNIGNRPALQVPGKIYEYLGAARPILHIEQETGDPCSELVRRLHRGVVCEYQEDTIKEALQCMFGIGRSGLESRFDLAMAPVQEYSWPELAKKYLAVIEDAIAESCGRNA